MVYVIVGNGVASVGAIEGIRKHDAQGRIIVLSEEAQPTYGRPLISYLLSGKIGPDRLSLRAEEFYVKNSVELKLSTRVASMDAKAKTVTTDSGETIAYDRLLLATGGIPFIPPIPGVKGEGIYCFTTVAHANALIELSGRIKKAVVIGGGLIGLKAAEGLHDRGLSVSVVELASRVLSAAFDDAAGGLVAEQLNARGIDIHCNVSAKEILRDASGAIQGVLLSDGVFLPAEAVVVAIGVAPCVEVAKAGGLTVNRGIVVDDYLRASCPDVYAAGDVAEGLDMLAAEARVTPIWPNAYRQGMYAGKNMANAKVLFPGGLAMNSIAFYGMPTASVGMINPPLDGGFEIFTDLNPEAKTYRKLVFKGDKLLGYVLVGAIDAAGLYTGFVRFQIPIDETIKAQLKDGRPSSLLWPKDFFDQRWNPDCEDAFGA